MQVLVTGAGGFLGRALARQLSERGHRVIALVRRRVPELEALPGRCVLGDVRDGQALKHACEGCQAVAHVAAKAGLESSWDEFYSTNVVGTLNVLEAARHAGVERFVYTSSPSVTFSGEAQRGVDESVPYPTRWLAHYPHSKALAEQAVLAANDSRMATCALRPHLLWGPGDPHLAPRLWQRARQGRLVQVGTGNNRIDITFIDNAAWAHVLALEHLTIGSRAAGHAYFVSDGQPVFCWQWIAQILSLAGLPPPRRRVPYRLAYASGAFLELVYWAFRFHGEPPMTRFLAAQLAVDHYYDTRAIQRDLGYLPIVDHQEGLARWKHALEN